jgi:hypothetical protein
VTATKFSHRLAIVEFLTWDRCQTLIFVGDSDNQPATARVGKRSHNLWYFAAYSGGEALLELEYEAFVIVSKLSEVAIGDR